MIGTVLAPALKWFTGAGFGMIAGWLSEITKAAQDERDKRHELDILRLQYRFAEKTAELQIAEREIAGKYDLKAERAAINPRTGIRIVDVCNGLMRPFAAAACVLAFLSFSGLLFVSMAHDLMAGHVGYLDALKAFEGSTIADTIMVVWGFLFGARSFKAARS